MSGAGSPKHASDEDRIDQLRKKVVAVLQSYPDGVLLDSFWNYFLKIHKKIPSPGKYGVQSRLQLLKLTGACVTVKRKGKDFVIASEEKGEDQPSPMPRERTPVSDQQRRSPYEQQRPSRANVPQAQNSWGGGPQRPHRQLSGLDLQHLNSRAQDCIDRLAANRKYVSVERIEALLLNDMRVSTLDELGLARIEQIPVVREHIRTMCKVNAYVQGFVKVRGIATLHELSLSMQEYVHNGQGFEQLKLGPLNQQPVVYDFFKFPSESEIPAITTAVILEDLREFLTQNNLWTSISRMEDFMTFMLKKRHLDDPYLLGIRISSLPLAISVSLSPLGLSPIP